VLSKLVDHIIGNETIILTFQNAIGNAEKLEKLVSASQIAVGGTLFAGGIDMFYKQERQSPFLPDLLIGEKQASFPLM